MIRRSFVFGALGAVVVPTAAQAGGLFIPGTGPQAQGRAGAFVAKADDGAALAHNPAGLSKIDGTVIYVGANFVNLSLDYTRAGTYETTAGARPYEGTPYPTVSDESSPSVGVAGFQAVPLLVVSTDLGKPALPVRLALGLYAPQAFPDRVFGETAELDNGQVAAAPGRYDVIEQHATTALPSLAVAYRPIDQLDVGVRASWGISSIDATTATWGARNYEEYEEKDGVFNIRANDNFVPAFGLGLLYRPTPAFELGAAYSSALHIRAQGEGVTELGSAIDPFDPDPEILPTDEFVICDTGGQIGALASCIDLDIPQHATVGARWIWRDADGGERADVEFDVRWENWGSERASDFDVRVDGVPSSVAIPLSPTVIRHGLEDVWSFRLGGGYNVPAAERRLRLRAGVAYDTKAADEDYNRLDFDSKPRTTIGLGVSYAVGRFNIDAGGGYVLEPDRTVENDCRPPNGPTAVNQGCGGADETPVRDRVRPDPAQPLADPSVATESPFNAGTYESGYALFSLGVSARF